MLSGLRKLLWQEPKVKVESRDLFLITYCRRLYQKGGIDLYESSRIKIEHLVCCFFFS